MRKIVFCSIGSSPALIHARNQLSAWGYPMAPQLDATVTHLLLPVPSLDPQGNISGGPPLSQVLAQLSGSATVIGGMLPQLPFSTVDLLQDAYYTAENAAITAHCALSIALQKLQRTLKNAPVLVIGWGRIGKCLAELLQAVGANTSVAVRKETDCAMLQALGYTGVTLENWQPKQYILIFNTVPAPVLQSQEAAEDALLIDLASKQGILGDGVYWERALPGRMAPETSGILIAKTALRYALGKE